ncbi:uncharacterized protein C4orf50 homolog [Suricata suricatta]|uniref:uncharacterized protein C4orf50 homolog n=1 Tax=Suricata suricatta TaxID=37032 RepID=UPI001155B8FB|nr:uncharacterized protein C4orf50 homolog [Suricata suricatta]
MESAGQGRTQKSFSYVVRAPGSDGFDVMNVDVKIDTSWVFQDVEEGGEGPSCPPAAGRPDLDTGSLSKQLESSERKLVAAVDKYVTSESGLRSRIQELELSERQLLRRVDQLSARVLQERREAARAQEELQVLQGELASQVLEKERAARRQRWRLRRLRERLRPVRGLREQRATERRLRGQLEDLRCRVYALELSEIGLQGRVEDLAQQNRSLREERGALAPGESARRSVAARPCSPDALSQLGDEPLPLPGEGALDARRSPSSQTTLCSAGAPGPGGLTGWPSEGCCSQDCGGAGRGLETTDKSLEDVTGSDLGRAPAEPSLDKQTLLTLGCPPRDGSLLPVELAWTSEQRVAAVQVLVQTSTLPPWGPAGDPPALPPPPPLWEASPPESQVRRVLDTRFPPAPRARGPACRNHRWASSQEASLCPERPQITSHQLKAPRDPKGPWKEEGGPPEWRTEEQTARRTLGREEEDLGDKSKPSQESREDPGPVDGVRAPGGVPTKNGASETPASASCPWSRPKLPLLLLQGEASVSTEGPPPLSGGRREGGLSSSEEEETPPARAQGSQRPSPAGAQPCAGQGEDTRVWSGNTLDVQAGSAGHQRHEEKEEKASPPEGSCLGPRGAPGEPGPEEREPQETLFPAADGGLTLSPRLAFPPRGTEPPSDPWALSQGPDRSELRTDDDFEKEAETSFRQLFIPERGGGGRWWPTSRLAGESRNSARKRPGRQDNARSHQALTNQGWDMCLAREVRPGGTSEQVAPGGTEVLGANALLPGTVLDLDDACPSPERPSRLAGNQASLALGALEGERRFHQVISRLEKERSQESHESAEPRGDRERGHSKACALETERERNATEIATLEQEKSRLSGEVSHLKRELGQYWQVISDLEDCNGKSYGKISELEEENEQLKRHLAQLQKAMAESARKSKGLMEHVTLEKQELKALISELGVTYKELMKGVVLGIEDTVQAFRGENAHLLSRIRVLETEVALGASTAVGRLVRAEEGPHGESKMLGHKASAVERGVQVTQLSGQLTAGAHGPPLEENPVPTDRCTGPSLGTENSRSDANSATLSLVWGSAEVPRGPRGNIKGAGVEEVRLEKEKRPWCSADPAQALRALSNGLQSGSHPGQVHEAEVTFPGDLPRLPQMRGGQPPLGTRVRKPWSFGLLEGLRVYAVVMWRGFIKPQLQQQNLRMSWALSTLQNVPRVRTAVLSAFSTNTENAPDLIVKGKSRIQKIDTPRDLAADAPREDLRLCIGRLQHQVLTLRCQLRDQASAHRELQVSHGEATRLRDQLKGELEELQKKQHEANSAVAPLKAKLASLVQKCRERNCLITHLLQELRAHGVAGALLSETARSMVDDAALAEYAATFLAPGTPEASTPLAVESETAAAVRAQKYLPKPHTDSTIIQRPLHSEPWAVPEAERPAPSTARPDSPQLSSPSGPAPDPGACPEPECPARSLEGEGGLSRPVRADDVRPPTELLSPARILAFHRELRQSICSNPQVNKSPLEL